MTEPLAVDCSRRFAAPVDRVYRAFTEPDLVQRWWSPDPAVLVEVLSWDLRPGGAWRFGYRFPDATLIHVGGVFRVVQPLRRLVFTWTWEPPDAHAGVSTLVTVDLDGDEEETTVRVIHDRFPDALIRDRHDAGWNATLDRLPEVLL